MSLRMLGSFFLIWAGKISLISRFGSSVPFWDQWDAEAAGLYLPYLQENLSLGDLFLPHNEHRIFWTRLLSLGLFVANGQWDPLLVMIIQAAFFSLTVALAAILISKKIDIQPGAFFLLLVTGVFLFPFSWENTLWGFQSHIYFTLLFGFFGIYGTLQSKPLGVGWLAGLGCLWAGLFSTAGGLLAPASVTGILILQLFLLKEHRWRNFWALLLVILPLVCGVLLRVELPGHSPLKAKGVLEFLIFFLQLASWPTTFWIIAWIFLLPLFWLGWIVVSQKPAAKDVTWLLLSLGGWHLLSIAALSYGRATTGLASRYTDGLAFSLITSLATVLYLYRHPSLRMTKLPGLYAAVLVAIIFGGLWSDLPRSLQAMVARKEAEAIQTKHLVSFLETNDPAMLGDHPPLDSPYPDPGRLAQILRDRGIQTALPTSLQQGLGPSQISFEGNAFVKDGGLYPTTPTGPEKSYFGSYGPEGDKNTGTIRLTYSTVPSSSNLEVAVAGYPRNEGIQIYLETENGGMIQMPIRRNPKENWQTIILKNPQVPFTLVAKDKSLSAWLAVRGPVPTGRLSVWSRWIMRHTWVAASLGTFLLLWGLRGPCRETAPQSRTNLSQT